MTIADFVKAANVQYISYGPNKGKVGAFNMQPGQKEFFMAHKDEIKAYVVSQHEADEKAAQDKAAKIDAFEKSIGYPEYEKICDAWAKYHDKYEKAFETEDCIYPAAPDETVKSAAKRLPDAARYAKLESGKYASNYAKSGAYRKAWEQLIAGTLTLDEALAQADKEWSSYCDEHIWD